jgi:hypothetical protein
VTDLVAFLRARLDEDEAAAKAAEENSFAPWAIVNPGEVVYFEDRGDEGKPYIVAECDGVEEAEHIARHDPARVLREVEAKRRIVDRYEDAVTRQDDPAHSRIAAFHEVAEYDDWVLPLLALPYSDHPDYREEWRP